MYYLFDFKKIWEMNLHKLTVLSSLKLLRYFPLKLHIIFTIIDLLIIIYQLRGKDVDAPFNFLANQFYESYLEKIKQLTKK